MGAYYNENDPKAAAWLRELIKQGHIAPGEVDERSIVDVAPNDLQGFQQVHWFAGIGVWGYALRLAGWADNRRVWTGSCPCQPFSAAGKGAGTSDERHLWPYWEHLIRECCPPVIFGEQVASKAADGWADLVQDDLEALGYAFGAVPFPAASVGAPHIRDRLYWVAHHHQLVGGQGGAIIGGHHQGSHALAWAGSGGGLSAGSGQLAARGDIAGGCGELGDASSSRTRGNPGAALGAQTGVQGSGDPNGGERGDSSEFAGADGELGHHHQGLEGRSVPASGRSGECTPWSASDFVWCRDGKWRPVEPGTFPLAHGAPARVGRLRGYGNAIVSEAAKVFIEASGLV